MNKLSIYADLSTLYGQEHRKYHNLNHINDCLVELEKSPWEGSEPIGTSIWFHDAIYNPYSKTNEDLSANLYADCVNQIVPFAKDNVTFINNSLKDLVTSTILATKKHTLTQADLFVETQVMLDIDLAGLGKDWKSYVRNYHNIAKEYYNTSQIDFLKGRIQFLRELNKRETFYYTEYFQKLYHVQSKTNVELEIEIVEHALTDFGFMEDYFRGKPTY